MYCVLIESIPKICLCTFYMKAHDIRNLSLVIELQNDEFMTYIKYTHTACRFQFKLGIQQNSVILSSKCLSSNGNKF